MTLPFEDAKRTVWQVKDRVLFFTQMRPLFGVDDLDAQEIVNQLGERDFDYLEIASYLPNTISEDPDAILVFDGKKDVYWDMMDPKKASIYAERITQLSKGNAIFTYERGLTQRDWRKRLEALSPINL